ncbi:MAG: hypothetical protein PHU86_02885 [Patescibacteria group bacterium]|nr:hypothetical protein [Patescibacteria group bacterium]
MKKIAKIIMLLSLFVIPGFVSAAPMPGTAVYDLSESGDALIFGAFVCKLDSCDPENQSDWFNYSATGTGVSGDNGQGAVVVVAPGDTVTFLGMTSLVTSDLTLNPRYDVSFTGGEYLDGLDFFSNGTDDIDNDGIGYTYDGDSQISLSQSLGTGDGVQVGSITAKINENAPDGAVIVGKLALDDSQFAPVQNPFVNQAYAAEVAQSSVRLLVRNAQTTTAVAQTLPKTGVQGANMLDKIFPYAVLGGFLLFIGFQLARRKKQT